MEVMESVRLEGVVDFEVTAALDIFEKVLGADNISDKQRSRVGFELSWRIAVRLYVRQLAPHFTSEGCSCKNPQSHTCLFERGCDVTLMEASSSVSR